MTEEGVVTIDTLTGSIELTRGTFYEFDIFYPEDATILARFLDFDGRDFILETPAGEPVSGVRIDTYRNIRDASGVSAS
jgi:hypothetical protein